MSTINDTHAADLRVIGWVGRMHCEQDAKGERVSPLFVPDDAASAALWTAVGCDCCAPLPANDAAWEPEPEAA